ncbi:SH3 and PX-domain-containing 3 [Mycena indigotica]|uniref:SH3 and PX-domain-containing 3 n=1 Tax=Mycena indigotica TaxID=2126181 RepID=A0A8H6WGX9_9AGAR|nr:SH3 and PX-domain-containing 3 [Mycena indigotica]KAF7316396.1 SH3 and PX-domain-containing 3 [Mycena indigotica]
MSTLPRSPKNSRFITQKRPHSDFDAGINSSTAWTEHLEATGSLSDDEPEEEDGEHRQARALYNFEGKTEFRELSVEAGDELEVVKEDLADGWSLVKNVAGEIGLLPRTYYTFTADFTTAPEVSLSGFTTHHQRDASSSTITPRGSLRTEEIVPQNTGEWRAAFPSFRQSLLGGKSLNRFSTFVTSGAEEWVLKGSADSEAVLAAQAAAEAASHQRFSTADEDDSEEAEEERNRLNRLGLGEADHHFVDAGHNWKTKLPPFQVLVHSPSKRTSTLSGSFTIYNVTALFHPPPTDNDSSPGSPTRVTVYRRFSHFVILHTALTRRLPGIALPPLPEKQYAGRFSEDFVEARRGDLERYISRIVRHPVARYAEVVTFFLGCESDTEWKRLVPQHLAMPAAGPSFYARVFHPDFNVDADEASDAVERFDTHTRAVGKGVQGLRNIFGRVRDARIEMSKAERLLSYSLLSLITSQTLASAPVTGASVEEEEYNVKGKGLLNEDGAWCWREGCSDCLKLTNAMQKTSEVLQSVADLYDDHARRTQLSTHEALKGVAHPSSLYQGVITTHRSTLSRYSQATTNHTDDEMASRCETVLNTTMAEMETYHTQKTEDFSTLAKDHLDGEIAFYEQVLSRLKTARRGFDEPQFTQLGAQARQASIYERELEHPRLTPPPLSQPAPHVFDAAPMRPVSVAIQEGMGMLLGPSSRGSVFGKFW